MRANWLICSKVRINKYIISRPTIYVSPFLSPPAARQAYSAGADTFYIFDHFDTFYSLIECATPALLQSLMRATDLLFLTIDKLGKQLAAHLADKTTPAAASAETDTSETTPAFDREAYLNLTKMLLYLSTGFVRAIDEVVASGGGSKTGKKASVAGGNMEMEAYAWDEKRYKMMLQVFNVFQLPLEKLWSLCIAEENFVK